MINLRIDGQTVFEMSEQQLRNLLPKYKHDKEVTATLEGLLRSKSVIRHRDARSKRQADPDFTKGNF